VGRAEQGAPEHAGTSGDGAGTANARAGARLVPWFALLGISLAATGMLAYSWLFYDRGYAETDTDLLVDVFTFAIMGAMAAFALYMARRPDSRSRMTLELLFVVVLASLVAFFAITVTLTLADGHLYGLARIIKRIARVATFITVLVLVYQCDLDPAKPFVFAFLVPSILPRALQMALAATPWGQGLAGQGGNLMAILLATGFFLVMCLVVFCMLNMDGGLARGILREGGLGQEGQPGMGEGVQATSEARQSFEVACEDLARERALTRREREVMRMYAEGASAQEVALAFSVSVGTVNTHARTLYRKLDIHSKQELADLVAARARSAG
jgi:DNA-binding CsgD family transcriptional regulator